YAPKRRSILKIGREPFENSGKFAVIARNRCEFICYKSGVKSNPFIRLNDRKRCGLISFIWGDPVEVRTKQTKIWDTSQEVHERGVIRIESTDYS
ncbi:MAG: hypothetical protein ACI8RD_003541, partial [Bacillariaceae sp.]